MGMWVASTFGLLGVMLLRTWVHKYLFEALFSVLPLVYPEEGLLNQMLILCLLYNL